MTDGTGNNREQLLQALRLLLRAVAGEGPEAGPRQRSSPRVQILQDPSQERVALPYVQNLRKLGFDVQVRTVDPAQYQHLMDNFDFDMTMLDLSGERMCQAASCAITGRAPDRNPRAA